jgi:hypothetical protein
MQNGCCLRDENADKMGGNDSRADATWLSGVAE